MLLSRLALGFLTIVLGLSAFAEGPQEFNNERAPFPVQVNDRTRTHKIITLTVFPGDTVQLSTSATAPATTLALRVSETERISFHSGKVEWKSPNLPGLHKLAIVDAESKDAMAINVFVCRPLPEGGEWVLNGYVIGSYDPSEKPRNKPPRCFIEVTKDNEDTLISPHFRLKQFFSKGQDHYPKYLVLSDRLLEKLELLLEEVNKRGIRAQTFVVMSGYRTPDYNRSLKNVPFGRHLWGEAADIFVDEEPQDGKIDDLNHDGAITLADAKVLFDIIDDLDRNDLRFASFKGGLGLYEATAYHGPFVHTDVGGGESRW